MRIWQIEGAYGIDNLRTREAEMPQAGPGQVVVSIRAASLNYRDLLTVRGHGGRHPLPLVPFSDGSGQVVAVGEGVSRVQPGDRVCPLFFQSWLDGPVTAQKRSQPLGGPLPGVLQEQMLLDGEGVSKVPAHLTFEAAATLPCAALTAWRAVAIEAQVSQGDTVLIQGTGGVSIFALQFAKARGARVIATSSSDVKLDRARAIGADEIINYRSTPDWGARVLELTGGKGVDVVVEVGGESTLKQSLEAARVGGAIVVIGVLGGFTTPIMVPSVFSKNLRVLGISVGSREHFDDMCAHIERWKLEPIIDRCFAFDQVPEALRLMEAGGHFGKIVVRV